MYIQGSIYMDTEYTNVLSKKLAELQEIKNKKTSEISKLLSEVEVLQKSIENLVDLLKVEGFQVNSQIEKASSNATISELAHDYLMSQGNKQPRHYMDIYKAIISSGKQIPGKNPAANLLTHMIRDERFVRISSGTYGLSEWGLVALKSRRKRRTHTYNKKGASE